MLEGLDSAVYVTDPDTGGLLYVNEQFRREFATGAPPQTEREDQAEFHDGARDRWYLVRTRTIRWVDGRMVRLHIATDLTERKRAEALEREQKEKLQVTARLITAGEMASTLAHELNQPLAAITNYNMGCVERLRAGNWNATELLDAMEKSGAQAERAGRVIQRVRERVRRRNPELAACAINDIISGVMAMLDSEMRASGIRVRLETGADLPRPADRVMIEQVIFNLARNAIEAMQDTPPARRELTLRLGARRRVAVEVAVIDEGRGIPPELEDNLFTPFFTTKAEGMGLGLQICRSIVEIHQGRLWAQRNLGLGSTFRFCLPAA